MLLSEPGIFLASVGAELDESIIDFFISIYRFFDLQKLN
jgi:hypothetical protein